MYKPGHEETLQRIKLQKARALLVMFYGVPWPQPKEHEILQITGTKNENIFHLPFF